MKIFFSQFDSEIIKSKTGLASGTNLSYRDLQQISLIAKKESYLHVAIKSFEPRHLIKTPESIELVDIKLLFQFEKKQRASTSSTIQLEEAHTFDPLEVWPMIEPLARLSKFNHIFGPSTADAIYLQWLKNVSIEPKKWRVFFATLDSKRVAMISAHKKEGLFDFDLVATHPDHTSKGYMGALLNFTTDSLLEKSSATLTVATQFSNWRAARLYQGVGFRPSGTAAEYWLKL